MLIRGFDPLFYIDIIIIGILDVWVNIGVRPESADCSTTVM